MLSDPLFVQIALQQLEQMLFYDAMEENFAGELN
jgi:hypothetical protein